MSHNLKNAFNDDYDIDEYGDPIRKNSREMKEDDYNEPDIDLGFNCTYVSWIGKSVCTGFVTFGSFEMSGECSKCGTTYDRNGTELHNPNSDREYIDNERIDMHDYVDDFYREEYERV